MFAKDYHHCIDQERASSPRYEWEVETEEPFDEMILTWNGTRPSKGIYSFYVRVFTDEWSPWVLYGTWRKSVQKSNMAYLKDVKVSAGTVSIMNEKKATRFQIRIDSTSGDVQATRSLHVATVDTDPVVIDTFDRTQELVALSVEKMRQMSVGTIYKLSIGAPVATVSLVRYLSQTSMLDPILFSLRVQDGTNGGFFTHILNMSAASEELGEGWNCFVTRAQGFQPIYDLLKQGIPVIVNLSGLLSPGAMILQEEHMVVVVGYDPAKEEVICMDPASVSEDPYTRFEMDDFIDSWSKRRYCAYLVTRS